MNDCKTCAWYCHADGKCYVPLYTEPMDIPEWMRRSCLCWTADGLTDEEREAYTLMTMEMK